MLALAAVVATAIMVAAPRVAADVEPDEHGQIAVLPAASGAHWLWVPDRILRHATLFDGDTGRALGTLDGSFSLSGPAPLFSARRKEIYVLDPVYARGHRGERKDYVSVYDATTLAFRAEIEIPPRSASIGRTNAGSRLGGVISCTRFFWSTS